MSDKVQFVKIANRDYPAYYRIDVEQPFLYSAVPAVPAVDGLTWIVRIGSMSVASYATKAEAAAALNNLIATIGEVYEFPQ